MIVHQRTRTITQSALLLPCLTRGFAAYTVSDTVEKVPTAEASSSSVEASITGENTEPTTTTTEKTKWGDVEDDDEEEANAVSELNSLSIKEESVLDEPEDSSIKAVLLLSST